jgi:hypothetical protein
MSVVIGMIGGSSSKDACSDRDDRREIAAAKIKNKNKAKAVDVLCLGYTYNGTTLMQI